MSTQDGAIYRVVVNSVHMELTPEEYKNLPQNGVTSINFTNKNTWGFYLDQVPFAKSLRDKWDHAPSTEQVLDGILSTSNRREQLAILSIASYSWDGDQGYGRLPPDDEPFNGTDF